jgi:hypothetical protein
MRSVQYLPWVGRIFYNRFGRGSEAYKESQKTTKTKSSKTKKKFKLK